MSTLSYDHPYLHIKTISVLQFTVGGISLAKGLANHNRGHLHIEAGIQCKDTISESSMIVIVIWLVQLVLIDVWSPDAL